MSNLFQTKAFKELQKKWYGKLEKVGFEDAETISHGQVVLRQFATNVYRQKGALERQTRADYYLEISRCVRYEVFDNIADKFIMTLYSEGANKREISQQCAKLEYKNCTATIKFVIRKYENRWGIRDWKDHQLHSRVMPRKIPGTR